MHVADVGISVDNATDVARSAADIILLEPSLAAISQGVTEGRRTFANTLKYIRMGTSSNFGNMISMAGAALVLPFLPMSPGQILLNNLIYDASQTALPSDNVDADVEAEPARWDVHAIERFMVVFGPVSSIFDYAHLRPAAPDARHQEPGLVPHGLVRGVALHPDPGRAGHPDSHDSPFWRSRPSRQLGVAIVAALAAAVIIPLSPLGSVIGFGALPWQFWLLLVVLVAAYLTSSRSSSASSIVTRRGDRKRSRARRLLAARRAGAASQ